MADIGDEKMIAIFDVDLRASNFIYTYTMGISCMTMYRGVQLFRTHSAVSSTFYREVSPAINHRV